MKDTKIFSHPSALHESSLTPVGGAAENPLIKKNIYIMIIHDFLKSYIVYNFVEAVFLFVFVFRVESCSEDVICIGLIHMTHLSCFTV